MGMNSSKSSQKSEPWKEQQPYLKEIFQGGQDWYNNQQPLQGSGGLRQSMFDQAQANAGGSQQEQALGNWLTGSLGGQGERPVNTGSNPYAGQANQYTGQGNPRLAGLFGQQQGADTNWLRSQQPRAQTGFADTSWLRGPQTIGENAYLGRLSGSQGRNEALSSLMGSQGSNRFINSIANAGGERNEFINRVGDFAGAKNPYGEQVADFATGSQQADALFNRGDFNPYQQQLANRQAINPRTHDMYNAAARGVTDQFQNAVLPGLNATFGGGGATGGSAHALASGEAAGRAGDTLADLSADIYGRAYESGEQRRIQGDIAAAGLSDSQAGRRLARDQSASQLGLQGLTTAGEFGRSDLDRTLSSLLGGGNLAGQDLDRNLRGLSTAGQLTGQDLDRDARARIAAGQYSGQDLDRNFRGLSQAAQLGESGLERRARLSDSAAERALRAQTAAAGFQDAGYGRQAQLDDSYLNRLFQGQSQAANLQDAALGRTSQSQQYGTGLLDQMLGRNQQYTGQDLDRGAQYAGQDLDRFAQSADAGRNRDLSRQLGAAGQVGGYEGLMDQNTSDLGQYSDDPFQNLARYANLIQMNPMMSSSGQSKSKGFSL